MLEVHRWKKLASFALTLKLASFDLTLKLTSLALPLYAQISRAPA